MSPRAGRLGRIVGSAPVTLPMLAAVGLFCYWAQDQGGYSLTTWAPGAVGVLGLLAICAWIIPLRVADIPRAIRVAVVALAAFTLWSFLSILWAGDQGMAWEGADRTLLYLMVFATFALWRQREDSAALVLGAWTLGMVVLAAVTVLRLPGSSPTQFFVGDRLVDPAGYPNAAAAMWLMAAWPALALASARRVPWALRGAFAGGAVVLCDVALLSQSRGALFATPVMLLLVFVVLPDRVRRMVTLLPIAIGVGVCVPALLRVADRIDAGGAHPLSAAGSAARVTMVAGGVVGLVVAAGAALEARRPLDERTASRAHRALAAVGLAVVAIGVVGGLAAVGNPAHRISSAWHSFKGGYAENKGGSRLTSGLGSNRYDFYRVGLDVFKAHPIVGIGADNFGQDYLLRRHSNETPRYPHSLEIRTMLQTGVIGLALLVLAVGAAVAAGLAAARSSSSMTRAVAAGALGAFAYWAVHGSADWFWEYAGLGAPAFAALGLAVSLAPRPPEPYLGMRPMLGEARAAAAGSAIIVGAILALALPWLSARQVDRAARVWPHDAGQAYRRLDRAASLDPLSDRPRLIEGSIAVRLGDLARADRAFAQALRRNPDGAYATLERGAIASFRGRDAAARVLLARAIALDPRDRLTRAVYAIAHDGKRVNVSAMNDRILRAASRIGG